tara:strand:- start:28 stop:213 length:186 start_codon:yes stop_codon:yes gene_type:complete
MNNMTFTEKMILTGVIVFFAMDLITKSCKSRNEEVPWLVSAFGVLSIAEVILFSILWIWSQ